MIDYSKEYPDWDKRADIDESRILIRRPYHVCQNIDYQLNNKGFVNDVACFAGFTYRGNNEDRITKVVIYIHDNALKHVPQFMEMLSSIVPLTWEIGKTKVSRRDTGWDVGHFNPVRVNLNTGLNKIQTVLFAEILRILNESPYLLDRVKDYSDENFLNEIKRVFRYEEDVCIATMHMLRYEWLGHAGNHGKVSSFINAYKHEKFVPSQLSKVKDAIKIACL